MRRVYVASMSISFRQCMNLYVKNMPNVANVRTAIDSLSPTFA